MFALLSAPRSEASPAQLSLFIDKITTDPVSGLAIYGYDPVAYFTDGKAVQGSPHHEFVWKGKAWRFASAANMAVFESSPDVYAPTFGGYDPLALMESRPVAGDPALFAIRDDKLYLFADREHRARFMGSATMPKDAMEVWKQVNTPITLSQNVPTRP